VEDINRVNTALAVAFITLAVMSVGGLGVTTADHTAFQKAFAQSERPDRFQGSDRCVGAQSDGGGFLIFCVAHNDRKLVNEIVKSFRNNCKILQEEGLVDKCSGSQTANGELCNWIRVKGDAFVRVFVFPRDVPCSEVRHIQKDLLGQ
jgi:hypothetical protein